MKKYHILRFLIMVIVAFSIYFFSSQSTSSNGNSAFAAYPPPQQIQNINLKGLPFSILLPIIYSTEQITNPLPPPSTLSRYVQSLDYNSFYQLGCTEGSAGRDDPFVILNFGDPRRDDSTSPPTFGTYLKVYYTTITASIDQIENDVYGYIRGYHSCYQVGKRITLAVGTTNGKYFSNQNYVDNAHGAKWAEMIARIDTWIKNPTSWEDHVSIAGAIDIELPWNSAAITKAWVNGYEGTIGRKNYYNYGTCDSCPSDTYPNIAPSNGWSLDDIWYVSYGPLSAYTIPEIYLKNGINSSQWQKIKAYGINCTNCLPSQAPYSSYRYIIYAGSLTQYDACHDPNNTAGPLCIANGMDNSPPDGWQQFWDKLNDPTNNPITSQGLEWSSDMSWKDE